MITWKVRNLTRSSLTVEDLGLVLQAAGGADDAATITEHSHAHSRSLRALESRQLVSVVQVKEAPLPIWPASKPPGASALPPAAPEPLPSPAPPVPHVAAAPPIPPSEVSELRASIDLLRAAVERLASAPQAPSVVYVPQSSVQRDAHRQVQASSTPDPQFIPSRILPDEAGGQIHVRKEESDGSGLDESAGALKSLRRRAKGGSVPT